MAELLHFAGGWGGRTPEPPPPSTRAALEKLLADEDACWSRFERACSGGVLALRSEVCAFREALLARGHGIETHAEQFEETFEGLLAVAEEYFPDSPAAVRFRLRERVAGSVEARSDGGVKPRPEALARDAVAAALGHAPRCFDEVLVAAELGHGQLYEAAHRIRNSFASKGHEYAAEECEDALWTLVHELLPGSPAASWDIGWTSGLMARAIRYVFVQRLPASGVAYEALDASVLDAPEAEIAAAFGAEDRARFRAAVRSWVRAGLREIERVRAVVDR